MALTLEIELVVSSAVKWVSKLAEESDDQWEVHLLVSTSEEDLDRLWEVETV